MRFFDRQNQLVATSDHSGSSNYVVMAQHDERWERVTRVLTDGWKGQHLRDVRLVRSNKELFDLTFESYTPAGMFRLSDVQPEAVEVVDRILKARDEMAKDAAEEWKK